MTDTWDMVKVEPERDRYGRYLVVPAKGGKAKSYTRATTIAETLDDRFNLEAWKVRTTALGIVQRPDLYAAIASTPADEKQRLNKLCDQAREAAAGSAGANLGTALHRFTERLNRGEEVTVPAPWDADIAAYRATIKSSSYGIIREYLERIVVLEKLGVAGMFDLILGDFSPNAPGTPIGGVPFLIADLKTGQTLDFSWCAIAVQLALYAHADTLYDPATKTHEAMPAVDQEKAIVIHLPAGQATCTLYEVDIAAGWEAAQHAMWAREWRKNRRLAVPLIVAGGEQVPGTSSPVEPTPPGDVDPQRKATPCTTMTSPSISGSPSLSSASPPQSCASGSASSSSETGDRRAALIARVKDLRPEQLTELARRWPDGVATFKQSDAHSDYAFDAIELVLTDIDFGGPEVHVDPPRLDGLATFAPPPLWQEPDGGAYPITDAEYETVKNDYLAQDVNVRTLMSQWADEAAEVGRGFSPRDKRTERRALILTAARGLACLDADDVTRAVIGYVMGGELQESVTIGMALGSLTLDEARRLTVFVEHFGRDIALLYTPSGIVFDGPGLASVA